MPLVELALGAIFTAVTVYAWQMENYLTIPFLLLFVVGYFTTGFLSIFQGRFTRRPSSSLPDLIERQSSLQSK